MSIIGKPNTIIKLPDGRIGTTCYHGLDGDGIKFGKHKFDLTKEDPFPMPDAMLRELAPWNEKDSMEYVGEKYKILRKGGW